MITRSLPRIVAIDPGSTESGVVVFDPVSSEPVVYAAKVLNATLRHWLYTRDITDVCVLAGPHVVACEFPVARGMPASNDLFLTVEWAGRFREAWVGAWEKVDRKDVKIAMCGVGNAKDSNIRAAIIDRFGGKAKAIGTKRAPGPLYGVKADAWSALAVALTYAARMPEGAKGGW